VSVSKIGFEEPVQCHPAQLPAFQHGSPPWPRPSLKSSATRRKPNSRAPSTCPGTTLRRQPLGLSPCERADALGSLARTGRSRRDNEQVVVETKVAASAVEAWDVTRPPTVSEKRCGTSSRRLWRNRLRSLRAITAGKRTGRFPPISDDPKAVSQCPRWVKPTIRRHRGERPPHPHLRYHPPLAPESPQPSPSCAVPSVACRLS